MPGTHSPKSLHFFTLDGNVLTSGGAKNLAKGQFAIVDSSKATPDGALVVSNFAGKSDYTTYEMRLGRNPLPINRSNSSKPWSSQPFTIKDVVKVEANFPKFTEQKFDDLLIGYDGINADTAITLEDNQTTVLDVILEGEAIGYYTGSSRYVAKIHFGKEEGETDQEVIERAVKNLKSQTLPGGNVKITDVIDIRVVDSTNSPLAGEEYVFSTLTIVDSGDSNALGRVQAQYPTQKVVRTDVAGDASVYTILHPVSETLADYVQGGVVLLKTCEDCPAGYDLIEDGFVYSVSLEDDGTAATATVQGLPGAITGTANKKGNDGGRGLYSVITDNKLTEAEIATFTATAGIQSTATIELLGELKEVCYDDTETSTAWVDGDTCFANQELYTIQLRDDECDGSRLAELQAAYPDLVIVEGAPTGSATQTITLTGTSGTANVTIDGVDYLATFTTNLTTTGANFVTSHATAINTATGLTVTNNAGVLSFVGDFDGFPEISIANASGTLAGTESAVNPAEAASVGGCQRVYSTSVTTNVVCDECSNIYLDKFTSEAPEPFDFTEWELVEVTPSEDALMGIRITGKPLIWYPNEAMRDMVPFYETSARIKVAGGYVEEQNFSFQPIYSDIFNVKRLSRAQDRDHLGAHLMQWEDASVAHFEGRQRHKDLYAKYVYGDESVLKFNGQYVQYTVYIHDSKYSQGVGRRSDMGVSFSIWAEIGKHQDLQNLINELAARAGVEAVQPLSADLV